MGRKVLVSGAGGFLGRHLCRELAAGGGWHVLAADLAPSADLVQDANGAIQPIVVTSGAGLAEAVVAHRPALVIHAAFINRLPAGWSERQYLDQVAATDLPLWDACAAAGAGVLLVGSSAVYGRAAGCDPIDETCPVAPVSLYGVAKALQELLAGQRAAAGGLQLSIACLFNLIGPGQGPGMVLPDWVAQAVAIARGAEPVLRVRNRATWRDFVDVRDAARALAALAADFRPGATVNVASGVAVSLHELSDALAQLCPVPYRVVESDPGPGASDAEAQRGSYECLAAGWGWAPRIGWRQSLADVWASMGGVAVA